MSGDDYNGNSGRQPAQTEGLVTVNSTYDRASAKEQHIDGASIHALHKVHVPNDLDVLPDEIAFMLSDRAGKNPYHPDKRIMSILTAVNGIKVHENGLTPLQKARSIQDMLVPVGVTMERIIYDSEGKSQVPANRLAVQVGGKASVRTDFDIPTGTFVKAVVPDGTGYNSHRHRAGGRPVSKVTLDIKSVENGKSFADSVRDAIIMRNAVDSGIPDFKTSKGIAYKKIEDGMILNMLSVSVTFMNIEGRDIAERKANVTRVKDILKMVEAVSGDFITKRKHVLRSLMEPASDPEFWESFEDFNMKQKLVNSVTESLSGMADLLRLENKAVIGKCVSFGNGVADIVM